MKKLYLLILPIVVIFYVSCSGSHGGTDCEQNKNKTDSVAIVAMSIKPADCPIKFKFYLERSGSMIAYDNKKTKGEFKATITDLLNGIPDNIESENLLFIVNNGVYQYNSSYKEFIQCKDIFSATKGLGDPRYTDFTCIFDTLLSHTNDNEISILASDLIYSTKDMEFVVVDRILMEAEKLTTSVFKGRNTKDLLLIKLSSDYDGKYYSYNHPTVGKDYRGRRPFYFVLMADHKVMQKLFTNPAYADFRNFNKLTGYENYYLFASINSDSIYYSIPPGNSNNKGTRFDIDKGQGHEIHKISDVEPNREGDVFITFAVDLNLVFFDKEAKCNTENYVISSRSNFQISKIIPIEDEMRTGSFPLYATSATHLMVLHTTKENLKKVDEITISMPNKMPDWISESSSNDDSDIRTADFSKTTFALEPLCKGIYKAYYSSVDDPKYFELKINIK